MRRPSLIWVGVLLVGSAVACGAWAVAQDRVKVEVTVPAVPNIGTVVPSQTPSVSEVAPAPRGMVYIGYRGAYQVAGGGQTGHCMFRDADNHFWSNNLTYYGMSNGYWIASVNGLPDTFFAFQTTAASPEAPYFKVLIHTPTTSGYSAWDEATRGNAQ
jgi:hypothetical protein